jgi:hypothetical protein
MTDDLCSRLWSTRSGRSSRSRTLGVSWALPDGLSITPKCVTVRVLKKKRNIRLNSNAFPYFSEDFLNDGGLYRKRPQSRQSAKLFL